MHSLNTRERSLIYTKNSVCPSIEPWGAPETTLPRFKSVPFVVDWLPYFRLPLFLSRKNKSKYTRIYPT